MCRQRHSWSVHQHTQLRELDQPEDIRNLGYNLEQLNILKSQSSYPSTLYIYVYALSNHIVKSHEKVIFRVE